MSIAALLPPTAQVWPRTATRRLRRSVTTRLTGRNVSSKQVVPASGQKSSASASSQTKPQRDTLIDVLRVLSAVVVVSMHWMSTRTHVVDGEVVNTVAYHGPVALALSWILQVMPLLFITGGVANTAVIDKLTQRGFSYGEYLSGRVTRMTTPVLGLAAFFLPFIVVVNMVLPGMGDLAGEKLGLVLWFLAVYIVVIAAAPLAVRLHDRAPWLTLTALAVVVAATDFVRFGLGHSEAGWVNLIAVWLFAQQLGVFYYRRTVVQVPSELLVSALLGSAAAIMCLIHGAGYPNATISTVESAESNMGLPTLAIVFLAVIQFCVLTLAVRAARAVNFSVNVPAKKLNAANNVMMGVYLWHLPVYIVMTGVAMLAPSLLLPADEAGFWWSRPVWFVIGAALLVPALMFAARWEKFWTRVTFTANPAKALVAAALASFAIGYIWINGLGVHGDDLWSLIPLAASVALNVRWTGNKV